MDIIKFLKTLNSAQASWQVSLALVLAMISGFVPLITPLYFFIIFIAFTINVPLVVFFLMSGVFTGLGSLLDPTFAQVGKDILTLPSLQTLFTQMYNYTPALWSSFNHTIVMGSSVVSLVLALPLFLIFNILLKKFRITLETKFKDSKYFSWLNPYSTEKLKEKPGVFRLWGGALFLVFFGTLVTIVLFVIDPVIKYALEYGVSKATGKTLTIEDVNSSFKNNSVELKNISLYEKGHSDVNIDKVVLKLNREHLLEKKLDIEIISFGNIFLNLSLEEKQEPIENRSQKDEKKSSSVKEALGGLKMPELPNIDNLLAKEDLQSVVLAKNIKNELSDLEKKYKEKVSVKEQKEQIQALEKRVKSLEKRAKKIHSLDDIKAILKEAKSIQQESKKYKNDLDSIYKGYKEDKAFITKEIKNVKKVPQADYEKLKNKYSLDSNGAMNFIGTYFSASLEKYLRVGNEYYAYIKPYLQDDKEENSEETKRLKGEWIHYKSKKPYPDFVIQKLYANVVNDSKSYALKMVDISFEQKLYAKPIKGTLRAKNSTYKKLYLYFEHNELGKEPITTLKSDTQAYKLAKYDDIKRLSINDSVINEKSHFILKDYTSLSAKINADFVKTDIDYSASKTVADKTIASILSNIHTFNIKANVGGTLQNPQVDLSSDLDKKLSEGFKAQLDKEKVKYRAKLKNAVNKKFRKALGDIDLGEFNDVEKLLTKDGAYKAINQQVKKRFSKKALEKRYKDKVKAKAKKAAQEKLKNLKFF